MTKKSFIFIVLTVFINSIAQPKKLKWNEIGELRFEKKLVTGLPAKVTTVNMLCSDGQLKLLDNAENYRRINNLVEESHLKKLHEYSSKDRHNKENKQFDFSDLSKKQILLALKYFDPKIGQAHKEKNISNLDCYRLYDLYGSFEYFQINPELKKMIPDIFAKKLIKNPEKYIDDLKESKFFHPEFENGVKNELSLCRITPVGQCSKTIELPLKDPDDLNVSPLGNYIIANQCDYGDFEKVKIFNTHNKELTSLKVFCPYISALSLLPVFNSDESYCAFFLNRKKLCICDVKENFKIIKEVALKQKGWSHESVYNLEFVNDSTVRFFVDGDNREDAWDGFYPSELIIYTYIIDNEKLNTMELDTTKWRRGHRIRYRKYVEFCALESAFDSKDDDIISIHNIETNAVVAQFKKRAIKFDFHPILNRYAILKNNSTDIEIHDFVSNAQIAKLKCDYTVKYFQFDSSGNYIITYCNVGNNSGEQTIVFDAAKNKEVITLNDGFYSVKVIDNFMIMYKGLRVGDGTAKIFDMKQQRIIKEMNNLWDVDVNKNNVVFLGSKKSESDFLACVVEKFRERVPTHFELSQMLELIHKDNAARQEIQENNKDHEQKNIIHKLGTFVASFFLPKMSANNE